MTTCAHSANCQQQFAIFYSVFDTFVMPSTWCRRNTYSVKHPTFPSMLNECHLSSGHNELPTNRPNRQRAQLQTDTFRQLCVNRYLAPFKWLSLFWVACRSRRCQQPFDSRQVLQPSHYHQRRHYSIRFLASFITCVTFSLFSFYSSTIFFLSSSYFPFKWSTIVSPEMFFESISLFILFPIVLFTLYFFCRWPFLTPLSGCVWQSASWPILHFAMCDVL